MSLSLPADAEPFIPKDGDLSDLRGAGVYALVLSRPDDLGSVWDYHFDTRPDYFPEFRDADTAVYVGASADVLGRLEDHRDGEVRTAALLQVCDIDRLRNVWWYDNNALAFEGESKMAIRLANHYPDTYVHQR